MDDKAPKHLIEHMADGTLTAMLPAAINSLDELERMPLYKLRDHMSSLMCQGYAMGVHKLFCEHQELLSIRVENSDESDNNGRNVRFEVGEIDDECDNDTCQVIEKAVEDAADYLNGAVRERIIYDFLDNFIDLEEVSRDKFDEQIGKAYDETFGETGAWVRLRAAGEALQLDRSTPASPGVIARPRM